MEKCLYYAGTSANLSELRTVSGGHRLYDEYTRSLKAIMQSILMT